MKNIIKVSVYLELFFYTLLALGFIINEMWIEVLLILIATKLVALELLWVKNHNVK
jgi:hypothetical protein|tara:strand:+ start:1155 stop:1322 length:168 start_codon:yes stop_codon:yes gene_type:complete